MNKIMAEVFKCCRNKANNNWICVVCSSIVHPSCWKRMKNYEVITDNLIYCSASCRDISEGEEDDRIRSLVVLVHDLKAELQQKNEFIVRLKRNSQACQEDFADIENDLVDRIKKYEGQISSYQVRLEELTLELGKYRDIPKADNETQTSLSTCDKWSQSCVSRNTRYCQTISASSVSSVETQTTREHTTEIGVQSSEILPTLASELMMLNNISVGTQTSLQTKISNGKHVEVQTRVTCFHNNTRMNAAPRVEREGEATAGDRSPENPGNGQILILGSSASVRSVPGLLRDRGRLSFDINCQSFLGAECFESLARKGRPLSKSFTKRDFVILFLDSRCAGRDVVTAETLMSDISPYLGTNLIIIGAWHLNATYKQHQLIYSYNLQVKKYLHFIDNNAIFISPDGFILDSAMYSNGLARQYYTKKKLLESLCNQYLNIPMSNTPPSGRPFVQRLEKLLGKQDSWIPKITTFPRSYPRPSDALRGLAIPSVDHDNPEHADQTQNFQARSLIPPMT